MGVICPICNKQVDARALCGHLSNATERGGHGYEQTKAQLYTSRAIAYTRTAALAIKA